ncbi:MAG: FtsW/RodA/SpoVE family cell cycle protein [bacterium]|nr:FtsW/RodA/SpoVE family cell cycle protein [bacterium]
MNPRSRMRQNRNFSKSQSSNFNFEKVRLNFRNNLAREGLFFAFQIFLADCWKMVKIAVVEAFGNLRQELRADAKAPLKIDGLEKVRKHRPDLQIPLWMGLIMLIGVITMYSLSPQRAAFLNASYGGNYSQMYFFWRQLMSLGLGLAAFVVASRLPINWVYRHSGKFLAFGFVACILLAILGFAGGIGPAKCELGACRWFEVGSLSVQPSEILKVGVLLALAVFLGAKAKAGKINDFRETILPAGLLVLAMLLFVAGAQKDLGTAISILSIVAFQFFVAGLSWRNIRIAGILLIVAVVGLIAVAPHRMSRVMTFLGEENCSNLSSQDSKDEYHICHAKIAIGSGGIFGAGIGNSVQATGYLPEAINDSIFAILGETYGFIGLVIILAIFLALILRLVRVSAYIRNPASRILAAGVCGWFAFHTVMNVSAMIGLLPLTGITMPLLSYGGTSILFISSVLGLVFNISAYTSFSPVDDFKEGKDEDSRSGRWVGRSRSASRRRI